MRINVIIPFDGLGGGMRIIAGYCNTLAKRGHEVTVLPNRAPKRKFQSIRNLGKLFGLGQHQSYFNWDTVRRIDVNFDDPSWGTLVPDGDAVIATWWSVVELVAKLPPRIGRLVHMIQGDDRVLGAPAEKVIEMWRLPAERVAVSQWLAQVVRRETGVEDVHVIRNAVDTEAFNAPARMKNQRPTLGYIFSPHECKGADTAAVVIDRVRREIKDLHVVCFGSLKPRLNGVRPPDGVSFIHRPAQNLIPSLYASCDVWLSTSRSEGSCLPPQEAMACRTPAVVTAVGDFGTPDLFGSGCFVVPIEDADALVSRTIQVLRSDQETWGAMSQAARQAIREWDWEKATDALENILAGSEGGQPHSVAVQKMASVAAVLR